MARRTWQAVGVGGTIAGALDLVQACLLFGWDVPLSIAEGLIGGARAHGGIAVYALGVGLHFFIALSAAAVYCFSSLKLKFLKEYPLVCGLCFGAAVENFMNLVVLPLSALHARGPYLLHDLLQGLAIHMIVLGLPIAYSLHYFGRDKATID